MTPTFEKCWGGGVRGRWCLRFFGILVFSTCSNKNSWEHGVYLWDLQNRRLWNISFGLIINLQGQNTWDKCGDIGNNLENGHMGTWRVYW